MSDDIVPDLDPPRELTKHRNGQQVPILSPASVHDRVLSVGPLREEIAYTGAMRNIAAKEFTAIFMPYFEWSTDTARRLEPLYT